MVSAGSFFYDYKNNLLLEDKILSINKSITNFPAHPQKGTTYFKSGDNIYEFISQNNNKKVKVMQHNFKGRELKTDLHFSLPKDFDLKKN